MSTIKLISFSLLVFVFSLTSFSTTYASNPMVVNEAAALPMYKAVVHVSSNVVSTNTPVQITSKATYGLGNLASLSLYVNGVMVASSSTNLATATYTPTSPGLYSVVARATYSNGFNVIDVETLRVL